MPLFAVAGGCRPNAIELARIAEVQAVLAFALQRYKVFFQTAKLFMKKKQKIPAKEALAGICKCTCKISVEDITETKLNTIARGYTSVIGIGRGQTLLVVLLELICARL